VDLAEVPPRATPLEAMVTVTDGCDDTPNFVLTSITSNEPDDGKGEGHTTGDIADAVLGTGDIAFLLRSERDGRGDGRKYTIVYTVNDGSGNTASDTVCVRVPHDQSATALAATGFGADGRALIPEARSVELVILAGIGLDPRRIDLAHAYVGHSVAVARPQHVTLSDVDGDGQTDLVLQYAAGDVRGIVSTTSKERVGLHFALDTSDYLVEDIFALGEPVVIQREGRLNGRDVAIDVNLSGSAEPGESRAEAPATKSDATAMGGREPGEIKLSSAGRVRIEVYDVLGRRVRSLLNRDLPVGSHRLTWDGMDDNGRRVASGVYFYRIHTPERSLVRRVVVVR